MTQYLHMLDTSTDRWAFMASMFLSHELPLLLFQLLISFLRTSGVWSQHQIQPLAQIPGSLMSKCNAQILIGHLLVQPVLLYFFYDLFALRGISSLSAPLPSYAVCLGQLAVSAMLCDTLNYWSHRTLHHSLFYARFHKQHHEFHSVVPLASEYFSPLEEICTGFVPTFTGPFLMGMHPILVFIFVALRVSESADAHCGYAFPWSIWRLGRPGDRHDFHHSHNIGNYGAWFTFWDRVCGTDKAYREYIAKKKGPQ